MSPVQWYHCSENQSICHAGLTSKLPPTSPPTYSRSIADKAEWRKASNNHVSTLSVYCFGFTRVDKDLPQWHRACCNHHIDLYGMEINLMVGGGFKQKLNAILPIPLICTAGGQLYFIWFALPVILPICQSRSERYHRQAYPFKSNFQLSNFQ